MDDDDDAYVAFQEGTRLLADGNAHAAVIALERARALEPDKGSVRETLARAYFRDRPLRRGRGGVPRRARDRAGERLRALRPRAVPPARRRPRPAPAAHLRLAIAMRPDNADYQRRARPTADVDRTRPTGATPARRSCAATSTA